MYNPLGPVHAYVAPTTVGVVRVRAAPAHTGLLLDAVGGGGAVLTVTATELDVALLQDATFGSNTTL
ncbi:MAG: hypothetical protein WKF59_07300 [Chitinophagaceae bacterium]